MAVLERFRPHPKFPNPWSLPPSSLGHYQSSTSIGRTSYGTIQNRDHWAKSKAIPNTCMVRIDASLFFTNVEKFKQFIEDAIAAHDYSQAKLNHT